MGTFHLSPRAPDARKPVDRQDVHRSLPNSSRQELLGEVLSTPFAPSKIVVVKFTGTASCFPASGKVEPFAGFDDGEDGGDLCAGLRTAQMDPVFAAQCDGPHRIFRQVVG